MRYQHKIVLVTGASQNTGTTVARKFLEEGAHVIVNSVDRAGLAAVHGTLHAEFGERAQQFAADIADAQAVADMFAYIVATFGRLDILINNACHQGIGPSFHELSPQEFKAVVDVNLVGTFIVSRHAVDLMLGQEHKGVIVNMGSNVSTRAIHNRAAYVASKSGIDGLTNAMAIDLGPLGIRTNTVAPGYIHTDRWDQLTPEVKSRRRTNIPLGTEATTEQIADAVLFLASPDARNINGARLVVDGGCTAQHMPIDVDF